MVKVCLVTLVERHVGEIAIVRILLDQHDVLGADRLDYRPRDRRLTRTCSAANADYHILLTMRRTNSPNTSAVRNPVSITCSCSIVPAVIPAAKFVMHEMPSTFIP